MGAGPLRLRSAAKAEAPEANPRTAAATDARRKFFMVGRSFCMGKFRPLLIRRARPIPVPLSPVIFHHCQRALARFTQVCGESVTPPDTIAGASHGKNEVLSMARTHGFKPAASDAFP